MLFFQVEIPEKYLALDMVCKYRVRERRGWNDFILKISRFLLKQIYRLIDLGVLSILEITMMLYVIVEKAIEGSLESAMTLNI